MQRPMGGIYPIPLILVLFPFLVRSTIFLTVDGDAFLDVYKTVTYTRSPTDPETFLLVNVVLDSAATQGTQRLLETNGATRGATEVIAHWPGYHHVLVFLNANGITANDTPLATSNAFAVGPATTSLSDSSTQARAAATSTPPVTVTITQSASASATPSKLNPPHTSVIIGSIVGVVAAVSLIIFGVIWYIRSRRTAARTKRDIALEPVLRERGPLLPTISVTEPPEAVQNKGPQAGTTSLRSGFSQSNILAPSARGAARLTVGRDHTSVDASSHTSNSHSGNSTVTTYSHSNNTTSPITLNVHVTTPVSPNRRTSIL